MTKSTQKVFDKIWTRLINIHVTWEENNESRDHAFEATPKNPPPDANPHQWTPSNSFPAGVLSIRSMHRKCHESSTSSGLSRVPKTGAGRTGMRNERKRCRYLGLGNSVVPTRKVDRKGQIWENLGFWGPSGTTSNRFLRSEEHSSKSLCALLPPITIDWAFAKSV